MVDRILINELLMIQRLQYYLPGNEVDWLLLRQVPQ